MAQCASFRFRASVWNRKVLDTEGPCTVRTSCHHQRGMNSTCYGRLQQVVLVSQHHVGSKFFLGRILNGSLVQNTVKLSLWAILGHPVAILELKKRAGNVSLCIVLLPSGHVSKKIGT